VHAGKVAIQDDDLVARDRRGLQRLGAFIDDVDGHPLVAKPFADAVGERPLVFDYENAHAAMMLHGR
jgi:hypothetical protein